MADISPFFIERQTGRQLNFEKQGTEEGEKVEETLRFGRIPKPQMLSLLNPRKANRLSNQGPTHITMD